ncbi:MAG: ABC transporter ATP-binding protein [Candidatus Eisenbacteria sp.]|nr:ABC transporter ATP-binding protein [Candidatus Eisenbacteria bacterium]
MRAECDQLLILDKISKTFTTGFRRRKVPVLRDVSLTLGRGEVFGLLGPNGAGKTTLMKIALGLVRPSSGRGLLLGGPLGDLQARERVGFQPEQPYLYPGLTAGETLDLMAGLSRLSRARTAARIDRVAEQCSLGKYLRTPVRKLSRGWLQRLTLACALLSDPELLLLDEPLGGLDPEARLAVKDLILSLRAEGKTVMVSSHILPDVEALADRVALLRDGVIIASGRISELLGSGSEGVEVEIECQRPIQLPEFCTLARERVASNRARWLVPGDDPARLQHVLASLLRQGASIHAITPQRRDLEAFFTQAMERARTEAEGSAWNSVEVAS